jgi:hypothetical protein
MPELTQGRMEDFWRNRRAILNDIDGEPSGSEVNGAIVRALARLEWLEGLEEADVSGMSPVAVMFIAAEFSRLVQEAYAIPGE